MKKNVIYFIITCLSISCNNFEKKDNKTIVKTKQVTNKIKIDTFSHQKNENKIIHDTIISKNELQIWDTISKLPEVIAQSKYVYKETNGRRKLQIWTFKKPDKLEKYYWIKVSEDNGMNLVSHFNFFVYPNNEIKYFETYNDTLLSLNDWRKLQ